MYTNAQMCFRLEVGALSGINIKAQLYCYSLSLARRKNLYLPELYTDASSATAGRVSGFGYMLSFLHNAGVCFLKGITLITLNI